jgi:hypothetical protein
MPAMPEAFCQALLIHSMLQSAFMLAKAKQGLRIVPDNLTRLQYDLISLVLHSSNA